MTLARISLPVRGVGDLYDAVRVTWADLAGHCTSCESCAPLLRAVESVGKPVPAAFMRCCDAGDGLAQAWITACRRYSASTPRR